MNPVERYEFLDMIAESINAAGEAREEIMRDEPLYGDADFYMWESVRSIKDLRPYGDVSEAIDEARAAGHSEDKILEALRASCDYVVSNIYTENNSILSWVLGECEEQIDGLDDIADEITDYEAQYINNQLDYNWNPRSRFCKDCIYIDMNYDVVYAVVDLELFNTNLTCKNKNKGRK